MDTPTRFAASVRTKDVLPGTRLFPRPGNQAEAALEYCGFNTMEAMT